MTDKELIEKLQKEIYELRKQRTKFDCCYTMGNVADTGGSHCPIDDPCDKCIHEREIRELNEEIDRLKRSEFICKKCGLRKDSEHNKGDF